MSLTKEEKKAMMETMRILDQYDGPMPAITMKVIGSILQQEISPRELLEDIGEKIKADHAEGGHQDCHCIERHQYMLDVCDFLEKQKLSNEIIAENLANAGVSWAKFEEEFKRAPTVTYVQSPYTIDTGVAGVYFIHPAAQH